MIKLTCRRHSSLRPQVGQPRLMLYGQEQGAASYSQPRGAFYRKYFSGYGGKIRLFVAK